MSDAPIRSGSTVIDGMFYLCVYFLRWLADMFGVSYNTINVLIFCLLWPAFMVILIVIIIRQRRKIKELRNKLKNDEKNGN
ncbi:MAG: hypothetical protein HZA50_00425 [Planctomycetes bacterium]|nr:hypothetical protein [Planctomycetota bacterium]